MRKLLIAVLVLGALSLVAWLAGGGEDADATRWRTAQVERGELLVEVTATGTLQPVTQVQVGTQVSGTVQALHVDFNSRVRLGDVVAQIDPALFRARVESDRANLMRSKADVTRVLALLKQAERDLERNAALVKDGLVTESEYEAALANRDSLQAQVDVARASVVQQEATLATSEVNLQYTTILSPIDGIVISRNVDVGQTVAASLSAPTLFVIAADLENMQVQAAVAEADIGRVVKGQTVLFEVDAFPGETFTGTVSQVRLASTTVQNVVTYTVLVDAPNSGERLLPGMTANLSFEIDRRADVLLVPDSALHWEPPQEDEAGDHDSRGGWSRGPGGSGTDGGPPGGEVAAEDGKGHVWVLRDDTPQRVEVETDLSDGLRTAVVGEGLHEGDEVITGVLQTTSTSFGPTNPFMPPRQTGGGRPRM